MAHEIAVKFAELKVLSYWNLNFDTPFVNYKNFILKYYHIGI